MTHMEFIIGFDLALLLHWNNDLLAGMDLDWARNVRSASVGQGVDTEWGQMLGEQLKALERHREPAWPVPPLDRKDVTDFAWRVLETLRREVPFGKVVSYGDLAAKAGSPLAARAVGSVMAHNRWPLIFPCHRVVGSDGSLTGFGSGLPMKEHLLRLEGALD